MAKIKRRKKLVEDTYKVSIQFKRWMDSQVAVLEHEHYSNQRNSIISFDAVDTKINLEAYMFIRGLLK